MEDIIKIFLDDFLKENCPEYFGELEYSHQIIEGSGGEVVLQIRWKIPYQRPLYDTFGLISILAWIYSKRK